MGIKTKNPDTMKSTILEGENAGFATTEADTEICAHLISCKQRQAWKFGEGVDKNLAAESEEREQDRKKASKNTKQGYLSCWKHETKTLESPVIPACVLCRSFDSCFHSTGLLCPDNFAWSSIVFHSVCCSASLETMHKTLYEIQLI